MLDGQKVRLEFDQQRLDRYQRTLAYLYLSDGSFVNREMVRQGYAHAYVKYPFRYMEDFREAELQAREEGRGLWAEPGKPQAIAAHAPVRVWVNTGSGVYHCPGTRYYGNTARGEVPDGSRGAAAGTSTGRRTGLRARRGQPCTCLPVIGGATGASARRPAGHGGFDFSGQQSG